MEKVKEQKEVESLIKDEAVIHIKGLAKSFGKKTSTYQYKSGS